MTTPRTVGFVFPYPHNGWINGGSELSVIRGWATSKVHGHARRTGCTVEHIGGWAYDVREDGRPAVACTAILRPLPTIATEVARLTHQRKTTRGHGE